MRHHADLGKTVLTPPGMELRSGLATAIGWVALVEEQANVCHWR